MNNMESENVQFDVTDLIYGQPTTLQVPHLKPEETTTSILERIFQKNSIPKEELRRRWINLKSEREKMMKQRNESINGMEYWVSKTNELEYQLNRNNEELSRLDGRRQFDDTDPIYGKLTTIQVLHQKPIETTTSILQRFIQEGSIHKEELMKIRNNLKSEREKMIKQRNKSINRMKHWVSKTTELEYQLNRNKEELARLHGRMIADTKIQD